MGYTDPGVTLAELLASVMQRPTTKYIGSQIRNALPTMSGPFGGENRSMPQQYQAAPTGASVFRPGTHSSGFGLGARAGEIASLLGQQDAQQQDPLQQLYQQLLQQLQAPVAQPAAIDKQDLMNQVKAAINPIYDQQEATAKANTQRGSADIQSLYGQLADTYKGTSKAQAKQSADAQKQVEALYGQLRSNIEGSYSRVSKEQSDLFASLGIQDALPDVLNAQAPAVEQASQAADENQAQQQQDYMNQGQADQTFYNEQQPIAKMQGNELSTNLIQQLQDYIGQTEAQRTSGIQSGYMDQLNQAQSQFAQQQQQANAQTSNNQQMLWQMLQSQLQGKQQQALTPDTFMSSLPGQTQNSVAQAFTSLQRSPEAVYGKVEDPRNPVPGTYVDTSPQWYEAQADKMLQDGSIDAATHQALLMYLQLYFKQGQ